jgi:hypothetical protein
MDMAALVFQPHLKTRRGTLRRETFLGCDRNHNPVDCLLELIGKCSSILGTKPAAVVPAPAGAQNPG